MIIPDEEVRAITFPWEPAIEYARRHYASFKIPFEDDLIDYMKNGFVVIRPNLFAMAKVINIAPHGTNRPEFAWFIRYAYGERRHLSTVLPFYLPTIVWCRNDDGRLRIYRTSRLLKLVKSAPRGRMETPGVGINASQTCSNHVAATVRRAA